MVTKKKTTKVESQKVKQKVDLQEPQENMDDKSIVDEPRPEETTVEESEVEEGMVYCKSCKKDIEPYPADHNRWRCPDCNKYTQSPDMKGKSIEILKETKPSKDRPYEIHSSRNIKFSGNELAQAEMLIASGVANNFNDLAKKAFNILFLKEKVNKAFGVDTNKMENQEPNPKRTMAQIQEQEMMKAYVESMKKGPQDPMMTMMMLKMMENQGKGVDSGNNGFMKDLMQMQMMKMMSGGENQQASALQKEIADLKQNMQMTQLMAQQQQTQQGNQTQQDYLTKMENIRAERDKDLKQMEVDAQKQRDRNMQLVFETKVKEIQNEMQRVTDEAKSKGGKADLSSFKDQLTIVKELSGLVGEREKGAGEYISETITNVAGQLQPAITNYMQQQQQQQAMQPQEMQQPPIAEQPQQLPQEAPVYEEPEFPMPESNMSQSEQNMSNVMESIYITPPKEKKE